MAQKHGKSEIVSFKVDESLLEAMNGIPNRSDFIRQAVAAALDSNCPLCGGTGVLTPKQKRHWDAFASDHTMKECQDCHEYYLVCARSDGPESPHGGKRSRSK